MLKKVALMVLLSIMLVTSSAYAYDVQLNPFTDEELDYSRDPIYTLSALGIISGFPDRTYRPNGALSREAFIKLIVMAAKIETNQTTANEPKDVAKDRWSAPYISIAYQRKWIDSLVDKAGLFHPEQTITRQEVAMVMGKFLLESETEEVRQQWLATDWKLERESRAFKDQAAINEAMQPYVYYAVSRGIMEGDPAGFKPKESLIRKQAAAVIFRLIDKSIAAQTIDFTGYYAILSYAAINELSKLSNVTLGWSHLEYEAAGTAKLNTDSTVNSIPLGSEEVIAAAEASQLKKDLMVFYDASNLKDFLKDKPAQTAFIDSLLLTLNDPAFHFTGVNIDFEGLYDAASAADYLSFLQDLKAKLGSLTLAVAVPPSYYYKGYDLQGIGAIADTVILMAYDFTHNEDKLPSAPLPLVNDAVQIALKSVPKEKLVLGISKQANQWVTTNGVTAAPISPAIPLVEQRLTMPGVAQDWMLPYFLKHITYTDTDTGKDHEIYYEDTQSIAKKLWIAKFYGLKGVSLWFMGSYTAADWELIGQQMTK
ncbi:glycoside hydrolase [Paenibacillus psychroresistens]|uniref:Glycoside hydrolase n=1 Tax=Paenibacillus psychroresistens TaxID=1778678 RepID=A0A6B8RER0_9BACL|nr:S-layer homology domain-containing protein [Paenibacillus psychroresistens]QGQ94003.1 glycoside hydrolase [Paenibacillus psychroresistens]